MEKTVDSWSGCYPSNWKNLITDESFAHPAKYSNKLIRRIYEHMLAEGWLEPGMTVVDPFGGVALGAFDACRLGLNWRGVELEPRFVKWGNENIKFWNQKYSVMPGWSTDAVLLRGNSRFLAQVLSEAQGCVSSPPYETGGHHKHQMDAHNTNGRGQGMTKENSGYGAGDDFGIGAAVSSPPFSDTLSLDVVDKDERTKLARKKGISNAANISPIDMEKVGKRSQVSYSGVVSSPPYADSINSENGIDTTKIRGKDKHVGKNSHAGQLTRYGLESAQLGAMKATDKSFNAAISSPPFAAASTGGGIAKVGYRNDAKRKGSAEKPFDLVGKRSYMPENQGVSDGQLANEIGTDFWLSARAIIEQVYLVLEPGAHAVWVVKNYVKNKQIVPFCEQWQQMCEAVGFVTLHEHHAMLVRVNGKSIDFEGKVVEHITESKSFFRRIAEKKGSPKIDFEVVLCMEKPHEVA